MGSCLSAQHVAASHPRGVGLLSSTESADKRRLAARSYPSSTRNGRSSLDPLEKRAHFGYRRGFKSNYRLQHQLGHGNFGRTFAATHLATGTQTAVKAIQKSKMYTSESVADVKREVKIMQALSGHENVVEFHEAFEDKNFVYIVMELCKGGELLNWIASHKKNSQYSERDAARIVRQMLKVAARCHLHGIVHRDLKPENFLFKSDGDSSELKVIDFGLSNYMKPGKVFQDVVGSPLYLAPEVLKRCSGPESDVWSIGVITYILLCGRRPFWERTESAVFKKILEDEPDFIGKPWPSISSSAKDFVKKLLVKNPYARLRAAQALSHPWVRDGEASGIPLDISVLAKIREFVRCSRLRKIALRAVTSILSPDEIATLEDQFNAIDRDKDGALSHSEIREALTKDKMWRGQEANVMEVLNAMDTNKDGQVDFDEFAAAAVHIHQLEGVGSTAWLKQCVAAFERLDLDKDGYITADELKLFTSMNSSFASLIDDADIDKDGRLNLQEFQRLLQ